MTNHVLGFHGALCAVIACCLLEPVDEAAAKAPETCYEAEGYAICATPWVLVGTEAVASGDEEEEGSSNEGDAGDDEEEDSEPPTNAETMPKISGMLLGGGTPCEPREDCDPDRPLFVVSRATLVEDERGQVAAMVTGSRIEVTVSLGGSVAVSATIGDDSMRLAPSVSVPAFLEDGTEAAKLTFAIPGEAEGVTIDIVTPAYDEQGNHVAARLEADIAR